MALAATGALLAGMVFVVVPQIPEAQRMLDFAARGAFVTADTPAQRNFILAMAAEAEPLAAELGYPQLSMARADKDGKIAYLDFVSGRGKSIREAPSAHIEIYPAEGKSEKQLGEFVFSIFKFSSGGGAPPKILKLEEIKDKDGHAAAYAERLAGGREIHYSAAFRRGVRLVSITLRPGPDPDDIPGKEKLRKLIPEGNTDEKDHLRADRDAGPLRALGGDGF